MGVEPRPWYRWRNVVLGGLLAVVAWIVYAVTWALTAKPTPTVDYGRQLEALSAQAQPPGDNGWPHLHEASRIYGEVWTELAPDDFDFTVVYEGGATAEELADARRLLEEFRTRGVFDELDKASGFSSFVRPQPRSLDGPFFFMPFPDLGLLRDLARALAAAHFLAVENGDGEEAVASFGRMFLIARACSYQPTIIDHLVGRSVAALAGDRVRPALVDKHFDTVTCRGWLDHLRRRSPLGPLRLALEGERRFFLDMVQHTHSDNGRGNGRMLLSAAAVFGMTASGGAWQDPQEVHPILNLAGFALADRKAVSNKANMFYDALIRRSEMSRAQRLADPFDQDRELEELSWRYWMLKQMLPALGRVVENTDAYECMTRGTMLLITVEGFRGERGRLPVSLDELVPGWLDAIPADPFSTDGFVYRLVSEDPHGRDFLLYSIGADGRDDGGTSGPTSPLQALMPHAYSLDAVFNQPLPKSEEPVP